MASKPGSIVHVELHSADPAKSKSFYGEVFGWKFEEIPEMNYTMWKAPNEPAGGLMKTMEGRPPQVLNYILSESVENTLRDITGAGGIVIQPKMEIPGQGWWALFQEPGGTMMAIYENLPQARPAPKPKKAAKKTAKKNAKKAKAGKKRK
jgi:predicted enzyme related to lactoylglutathione lyase